MKSTAVLHFICSTRLLAETTPSVGFQNPIFVWREAQKTLVLYPHKEKKCVEKIRTPFKAFKGLLTHGLWWTALVECVGERSGEEFLGRTWRPDGRAGRRSRRPNATWPNLCRLSRSRSEPSWPGIMVVVL